MGSAERPEKSLVPSQWPVDSARPQAQAEWACCLLPVVAPGFH